MLSLSPLFADHCVLQSRVAVPVWGTALPDTEVIVSLGEESVRIDVPSTGQWRLFLPPMEPGGPYRLTVENPISGEKIEFDDVMAGEVWLASGQSNMEFQMNRQVPYPETAHGDVRFFTVSQTFGNLSGDALQGKWQCSEEESARKCFSAVAYFFAEELACRLGEAVGIIHSSVGGSDALAWVSRESLLCDDDFGQAMRDYEERICRKDYNPVVAAENPRYAEYFRHHSFPQEKDAGMRDGWYRRDYDDSSWPEAELPAPWWVFADRENGAFWFRKRVVLPKSMCGKGLLLSLGAADKQDVTYVNGVEIGRTGQGFNEATWNYQRRYRIPADLVPDGVCEIAVRVFSFVNDGGLIGPANKMFLTSGDERITLTGRWKYRREFAMGKVPPVNNPNVSPLPYYLPFSSFPALLFENMIRPLIPFAIRGVVWFQGEHNTSHRPENYEALMELLIRDWRWHWGMSRMPFHQVSLANYHAPADYDPASTWAPIRQIQHDIGEKIGSRAIPAYDCGESMEIHFPDKRQVGKRLADIALAEDYKTGKPCDLRIRRIYRRKQGRSAQLVLSCENAGGLHATEGKTLFRVAELEGREFHAAAFHIEGEAIVLEIPESVLLPKFVRYAWADSPEGAFVYNGMGFPLPPCQWRVE